MSDEEPTTVREPVTLEAVMGELLQVKSLVLSLSAAVVELNSSVQHHLDSHAHDAERPYPKGNGNGAAHA